MNYWLVKQEPESYSFDDLVREKKTSWTGVRNFSARNNLRRMSKGDEVLFYHSGEEKAVVGVARVVRPAYADKTADEGDWSTVDLAAVRKLSRAVTLKEIKANAKLQEMKLVRQSRLSVMPVSAAEWREILRLAAA